MRILFVFSLAVTGVFGQPSLEDWACTYPSSISQASPAQVTCPGPHGFDNRVAYTVLSWAATPLNGGTVTLGGVTYTIVAAINNSVANQILLGAANGVDSVSFGTATNLTHAINDDGTGKGTLYSSATTAHPLVTAGIGGQNVGSAGAYNQVYLYARIVGAGGVGIACSGANNSYASCAPGSTQIQWKVILANGTGAWAALGSNATPGNYSAIRDDSTHYHLANSTTYANVSTVGYSDYVTTGQAMTAQRANTGGTQILPQAYTGESWSLSSSITTGTTPYFQVNIPGCPNPAHEFECGRRTRLPETAKYPGYFQSIANMASTAGVTTVNLTAAFPYDSNAINMWLVKPGTTIQLRNILDTPAAFGSFSHTATYTEDPANQCVNGQLVKFSPEGGNTVGAIQYQDQGGAFGVAVSGCGTGTVVVADGGLMTCTFDNAATAGHWVSLTKNLLYFTPSAMCHDNGASFSGGAQNIGVVQDSGAAGPHQIWWNGLNRPFTVQSVNGLGDGTGVTTLTIKTPPGYPDGAFAKQTLAGYGGPSTNWIVDSNLLVSPYIYYGVTAGTYEGTLFTMHNSLKDQSAYNAATTNRMNLWIKWGKNRNVCQGNGNFDMGTYTAEPFYVGSVHHFYNTSNEATYNGQWAHYTWTPRPSHSQGSGNESPAFNYPLNVTKVGGPFMNGNEGANFFDTLGTFYLDLHGLSCGGDVTGQQILLGPMTYAAASNEPDELVLTRNGAWSPQRFRPGDNYTTPTGTQGYDVNWTGPNGYTVQYELRYSTAGSLKTAGFSTGLCQNGTTTCTSADRIDTTANPPYVHYQSATMAQAPNIWWGIKPVSVPILGASGSGQNPTWIFTPVDLITSVVGDRVTVAGVGGNTAANQTNIATSDRRGWQVWDANGESDRAYLIGGFPANSGGAIQVTLLQHGYNTGDTINLAGDMTPAAVRGVYTITVIDANTIALNGTSYDAVCPCSKVSYSYIRRLVRSTLIGVVSNGAGTCTANFTVNHGLVAGWPIYVYGSTNATLTPGINITGSSTGGATSYTVTGVPGTCSGGAASCFTFSCPGVSAGTYSQDYGGPANFGIEAFPAVAIPVTGNGTYTGGGTIFSTEDTKNFAEINLGSSGPLPPTAVSQRLGGPIASGGAILLYAAPDSATCSINLTGSGAGTGLTTDSGGVRSRTAAVTGLSPGVNYTFTLSCGGGTSSATSTFTTPAAKPATGPVLIAAAPPGGAIAAGNLNNLVVDYGDSAGALNQSVNAACSTGSCTVSFSHQADSIVWVRRRWCANRVIDPLCTTPANELARSTPEAISLR